MSFFFCFLFSSVSVIDRKRDHVLYIHFSCNAWCSKQHLIFIGWYCCPLVCSFSLVSVLSFCNLSWVMCSRLAEFRSFQMLAKQSVSLKINLISWAQHCSRNTGLGHERISALFSLSSVSFWYHEFCTNTQTCTKPLTQTSKHTPEVTLEIKSQKLVESTYSAGKMQLSIKACAQFLIDQNPCENIGFSDTRVTLLWKTVLCLWWLMPYLKPSYIPAVWKRTTFARLIFFNSVRDWVQFF